MTNDSASQYHTILNLEGAIVVADDQHINLEIMKQLTQQLGVQNETHFGVNGQQAIDIVKKIVTDEINTLNVQQSESVRPVSVVLIDF